MRTIEQRMTFIEYRLLELASLIAEILSGEPDEPMELTYPTRFERAIHVINDIDANIKQATTFDDEE